MPLYLIKFKQSPATWARLIQSPEDRREEVRKATEALKKAQALPYRPPGG